MLSGSWVSRRNFKKSRFILFIIIYTEIWIKHWSSELQCMISEMMAKHDLTLVAGVLSSLIQISWSQLMLDLLWWFRYTLYRCVWIHWNWEWRNIILSCSYAFLMVLSKRLAVSSFLFVCVFSYWEESAAHIHLNITLSSLVVCLLYKRPSTS